MAVSKAEAFEICDSDCNTDKKDLVGSKLNERNLTRVTDITQKKADKEDKLVTEEKTSFFTENFQEEHDNILKMLECSDVAISDRLALNERFDLVTVNFQRLLKFFNDSVMFLPSYQSGKARSQLGTLQEKIAERKSVLMPKKKFAFKSKLKKTETNHNVHNTGATKNPSAMQKYAQKAAKYQQGCEIAGRSGETITLKDIEINHMDVSLSNLASCKIYLLGTPSTVHISNIEKCVIAIGPVSSSVFVDRCSGSEIVTGCQQLRVHHTSNTDFYLHVTSRAIIEDTTKVRFAPYSFSYPELQTHFELSGLNPKSNHWDQVDDFNWLATDTHSPNWQALDVENRKNQW